MAASAASSTVGLKVCVLPCTTAWTFRDTGSNGGYVDDGGLFYPPGSPLSINGSGGSPGLEDVAFGFGGFTSSAQGSNNFGGSLSCSGIVGSYVRVGLVAAFVGTPNPTSPGATCTIDAQAVVPITFSGAGLITPPCSASPQPLPGLPQVNCTGGRGVDTPISQANMQGAWSGVGSNSLTAL